MGWERRNLQCKDLGRCWQCPSRKPLATPGNCQLHIQAAHVWVLPSGVVLDKSKGCRQGQAGSQSRGNRCGDQRSSGVPRVSHQVTSLQLIGYHLSTHWLSFVDSLVIGYPCNTPGTSLLSSAPTSSLSHALVARCGKTTLTTHMKKVLGLQGVRCAALSLDSFYLTGKEQDAFAAAHSNNSLLQTRGNAGTHDLKLAMETLDKLKSAKAGETVRVPVYDKSLRCGKGDRLPEEKWDTETGPLDVILLEGWMMGFTPLAPAGPSADDSGSAFTSSKLGAEMKEADQLLQQYKGLFAACSCWIVIRIAELSWVYRWRLQAEQSMRSRCGSGMSDDEVQRFVSLYMPAYTAYLPGLYRAPWGSQGKPVLMARVDKHRNPV
ncbi:unnamed protein product [Chrysoparadoxa australica]